MFDTKIAIVVRDDLLTWQKLNVTAFLTSGVLGADPDLMGAAYPGADGQKYRPLAIQPMIVLATDAAGLQKTHRRGLARGVAMAITIEDMFATGNDTDNRATVKARATDDLPPVGLALRAEKKVVDKVTKGAKMHP